MATAITPRSTNTPTPLQFATLTASLPSAATAALSRLERAFLPLPLVRAVSRYEVAAARYDGLACRLVSSMSPAEVDAFGAAYRSIAESVAVLEEAGRLDLIAPAEVASSYRAAAVHYRQLAADGDFEGCEYVRDEMADCLCQLEAAGRLDLVGGA